MFQYKTFFILFRAVAAGLIMVHGFTRLLIGGIPIFGAWFESIGVPFGTLLAGIITFTEIIGGCLLVFGKWGKWLAPIFVLHLSMGIILVHAQHGWFVVGLSFNGVEYSVCLINAFLLIWAEDYFKKKAPINN
jgi:putative oxidoreductase